jgi:hypothetical protein
MKMRERPSTSPAGGGWTSVCVVLVVGAAWTFAGCCGGDATGPDPAGEEVLIRVGFATEGDDRLGRPGEPLPDPVVLQVISPTGDPTTRIGVPVEWTVLEGGGTVSGAASTDGSGRATAVWTLGEEGIQRLRVSAGPGLTRTLEALAIGDVRPVVFVAIPSGSGFVGGPGGRLFTVNPDGTGATPLTLGPFSDSWPQWSPDGRRIAVFRQFERTCSPLQGDLMVLDVASLEVTRVTDDGPCATAQGLSWSPDGTQVAMSRDEDIVVLELSTGARTRVVEDPGQARGPAWGPLGIAYSLRPQGEANRIHLVAPDGSDDRVLLEEGATRLFPLDWDTDGRRLSFFRALPTPDASGWSVGIYDAVTEDLSLVPGTTGGWSGAWSPDGSELLVTVLASGIGECTGQNLDYILRVDVASEDAAPVTPRCGTPSGHPTWRPIE